MPGSESIDSCPVCGTPGSCCRVRDEVARLRTENKRLQVQADISEGVRDEEDVAAASIAYSEARMRKVSHMSCMRAAFRAARQARLERELRDSHEGKG
jgi:hypothetical protein